ncbi:MAG: His/Gly/Thr/Pro-type tRNA ligase C-terminal domain-containing protein [Candidatus Zambryskibacteria bacterium]|nr:His/Gly/Thr/Pro-type tRNA ligase C-terminal domain-containing protein [Candidatus Zambryskibacteria bacterium]
MTKKEKSESKKSYLENITDKTGEIAVHYGFLVIKPPQINNEDIQKSKQFKEFDHYEDVSEKIALTRWYMEERLDLEAQPLAIHYKKLLAGTSTKKKPRIETYGFEIMGSFKSTSEALLLKCALAVLEKYGYANLFIDINSIGDRESIGKFERELSNYFRKQAHTIPAKIRQEFKKNHHLMLMDTRIETSDFRKNVPQPIGSLSENSRLHFKEVLECVETFDTAYKIKPSILSNKLYASNTIFEIRDMTNKTSATTEATTDGELLAYGYRYNHLAKKIGGKREIPTVGMTIFVKKNPEMSRKIIIKKIKKPRFYLVQLGPIAKLKALQIVEMLRKQKIPVYHSITKDKITGQLSGAEYMKATHVLIMGQKEAIENTTVVRNIANREQETVPLDELCDFLKKISKK